jgi:CRP-like cAMP-binding protein
MTYIIITVMTNIDLLIGYGEVIRKYKKGSMVIKEGGKARFFHQVYAGEIKMYNTAGDGQEFTQGIFKSGESFGEPPLFLDTVYPASASALMDSEVLVLEKMKFLRVLQDHPAIHLQLTQTLSKRLYFKSLMAREITLHDAAHRLLALIDFIKEREGIAGDVFAVKLTRQQLANLTGLRVETVIRTIGHLVKSKQLQQKGRKIFR